MPYFLRAEYHDETRRGHIDRGLNLGWGGHSRQSDRPVADQNFIGYAVIH